MSKEDIKSLRLNELEMVMKQMGQKAFRAEQIYSWLHQKCVCEWNEITNISIELKDSLNKRYQLPGLVTVEVLTSKLDGTEKYLFKLDDNNVIESVLMRYEHGNSVCISSQAGCNMGCRFCASALGGKKRDLTAGEMLEQVYNIQRRTGERVSNVVVMGTGEPFDNFNEFLRFYDIITSEKGLNIGGRNITVSTSGLVEKIYELADKQPTLTLAISLHAPNDELRRQIMPIAYKYSISDIMKACDYYFTKTGRRITFEYSLIKGFNDSTECAKELSELLRKKNCHVNLIPVNPIIERDYKRSEATSIANFKNILEKNRINVTIRREMGSDIDAACGQLRRKYAETTETKGG